MSTEIDFQNGFICGMATKGLTRSGDTYKPLVWNDDEVYTYFYIDFKKSVTDFSQGMWTESCVVFSITNIIVSGIERVSTSIFKIYANISTCVFGVTVSGITGSLLSFVSGQSIPIFSVAFMVLGLTSSIRVNYIYHRADFDIGISGAVTEVTPIIDLPDDLAFGYEPYDSVDFSNDVIWNLTVSEPSILVVLT